MTSVSLDRIHSLELDARKLKSARNYSQALELRLQAESIYDSGLGASADAAMNLNSCTYLALCVENYSEAERLARKCLKVYQPKGEHDEHLATYLFMLGAVLAERAKFDEAVPYCEKAIAIFAHNHGETASFVEYRRSDLQNMKNEIARRYIER